MARTLGRPVVTGGTGFIGRHLVHALAAAGLDPLVVTRPGSGRTAAPGLARSIEIELTNEGLLRQAFERECPSTIFHLAGTRARDHPNPSLACTSVNVVGTVAVLSAARHAGAGRLLIMGSAEEYGDQPGPLGEAFPLRPRTVYGASKAAATLLALALSVPEKCPVVVLRPFTVYGPGQPADMFVAEAVHAATTGAAFRMTAGEQRRDLVFVGDVVKGLLAAAVGSGIEGHVINLGSGRPIRLREVAERIWQLTGSRAELLIGARPASPEELRDTWADTAFASRLLGWEAEVDLDKGLQATIAAAYGRG